MTYRIKLTAAGKRPLTCLLHEAVARRMLGVHSRPASGESSTSGLANSQSVGGATTRRVRAGVCMIHIAHRSDAYR